jgi:LacI family transcriptional regulator
MMDRKTGFVMAMLENDIKFTSDNIINIKPDLSDIVSSLDSLFEREEIPTVIFVSHDKYVMALYEYLFSKGLKCPEDISVIGYDDIDISKFMTTPLTTIHQDFFEMGEIAAKILFALVREEHVDEVPYNVFLKPKIIIRDSVAVAKLD